MKPIGAQMPRARSSRLNVGDVDDLPVSQQPRRSERHYASTKPRRASVMAYWPVGRPWGIATQWLPEHAMQPQFPLIAELIDADDHARMTQAPVEHDKSRRGDPTTER